MPGKDVYLFGTCLIDNFFADAGIDAVDLLALCGFRTIYPQEQTCCAQPPYNSGYQNKSLALARQNIELFSKRELPLIVPSASCAGMFKIHYKNLFSTSPDWLDKATKLAERTYELLDFLADKLPYSKLGDATPVCISLHTSCSAKREIQVANSWKTILERMPNVTVYVPERDEECCGFGGTFSIKSPAVSAEMTRDKAHALIQSTPECILSGDCGCLLNIQTHLRHQGNVTPCEHIASFVMKQFAQAGACANEF